MNQKDTKPSANKNNSGDTGTTTAQQKPDSGSFGSTTGGPYPSPAPGTPAQTRVTAKATYYLDGVKDSTSTYVPFLDKNPAKTLVAEKILIFLYFLNPFYRADPLYK